MLETINIYFDDLKDEVQQRILKHGKVLEQLTKPLLTIDVQVSDTMKIEEKEDGN